MPTISLNMPDEVETFYRAEYDRHKLLGFYYESFEDFMRTVIENLVRKEMDQE